MWTDERVELLRKLWADGLSASMIAVELGGITRNAVIGKVHRLGLSGRAKSPATTSPQPQLTKEVAITVMISTTTARLGVVAIPASRSSNRFTGGEFDSAYPVTKTSTIWNANARMVNSPLYHPVSTMSADPFGARTAANSAVRIVSATANI